MAHKENKDFFYVRLCVGTGGGEWRCVCHFYSILFAISQNFQLKEHTAEEGKPKKR